MIPTTLMIFVLMSIEPTSGKMTIGAQVMPADLCAVRLAEVRKDAPHHVVAWCANPGEAYEFQPEWKGN